MTLPLEFDSYTRKLMGDALYNKYLESFEGIPPVSIRLNPDKDSRFAVDGCYGVVPWCREGFILHDRPAFTFDPLFHAGAYYVQEAASMFVGEVARQLFHKPLTMLDLCAAPGGKTTALLSALPKGSLLFANEPVRGRASVLKENIIKWGNPNVVVTSNYPEDFGRGNIMFDAILADVPCSGEGMFRKDPDSIGEWSPQNVEKCRALQRSIIKDVWPCLKNGGILIYSTCTFNAHEDEENAAWIADTLGADFVKVDTRKEWNIIEKPFSDIAGHDGHILRFVPGTTCGEGLFIAVLRKCGDDVPASPKPDNKSAAKKKKHKTASLNAEESISFLKGDYVLFDDGKALRAIPSWWADIYNDVKDDLHILHAGVCLGVRKVREVIPDVSLALSVDLDKGMYPMVDLSYGDAIRYLRREAVSLDYNVPKGFVLVCYNGVPLGFVKNVGNRANNLYPQEWRIKSTHLPESPVNVLNLR